MEQLFRKKLWNGGGKKVIDRVWRKISFDCKSNPFFKNAHSNSQKLVKSLRVNHFDSTTSRFRTSQIWKIRLEMGICSSKGPNEPIWTTCPHCETRVLTRIITETYGCTIKFWFCCIPYYCTGDGKTALHTCPKCNYAIRRYTMMNQWESLWRIKYIYNFS